MKVFKNSEFSSNRFLKNPTINKIKKRKSSFSVYLDNDSTFYKKENSNTKKMDEIVNLNNNEPQKMIKE